MSLLLDEGFIDIDRHFAKLIGRYGGDEQLLPMVAAMLSRSTREGNICLPLASPPIWKNEAVKERATEIEWPTALEWRSILRRSKAVGGPNENTPLVLDAANRLYLRRYWDYQQRVAVTLQRKASRTKLTESAKGSTQAAAIEAAIENELTIIGGGPGTGKTTTIAQILIRLLQKPGNERLRVALAAPTGKAAVRLEETIRIQLEKLKCPAAIKERLPSTASTIHRLLGMKGNSVYFRHNEQNPLPLDLLVIDEASMIPLPLLAKVLDALSGRCRLLLLGDRDQLASVEPGAVLADMVDAAASPHSPLHQSIITLEKNYRFTEASGIHQVCLAVRQGNSKKGIQILREQSYPDVLATESGERRKLAERLSEAVLGGFAGLVTETDPATALDKLNSFRVLTPLRRGRFGVEGLNRSIEKILQQRNILGEHLASDYQGKPILISQNDYQLQLFNGDVGILLPDPTMTDDLNTLWAWFLGKGQTVRRFAPGRLPEHETAYAMTVHKSQGSEFERVLFILPEEDSPVLSRELIYTGLTRARKQVELWWNEDVFVKAVTRRAARNSGLRDLLSAPELKIPSLHQEQLSFCLDS